MERKQTSEGVKYTLQRQEDRSYEVRVLTAPLFRFRMLGERVGVDRVRDVDVVVMEPQWLAGSMSDWVEFEAFPQGTYRVDWAVEQLIPLLHNQIMRKMFLTAKQDLPIEDGDLRFAEETGKLLYNPVNHVLDLRVPLKTPGDKQPAVLRFTRISKEKTILELKMASHLKGRLSNNLYTTPTSDCATWGDCYRDILQVIQRS